MSQKKTRKAVKKMIRTAVAQKSMPKTKKSSGLANMIGAGIGGSVGGIPGAVIGSTLGGKLLSNVLGLAERAPASFGNTALVAKGVPLSVGGEIVQSADAPVAFARDQVKPGIEIVKMSQNGDIIVHGVEWVTDLETAATANTQSRTATTIAPFNTDLPFLNDIGKDFMLYRFLALRSHYTHFAPTNAQSRVALAMVPDVYWADGGSPTFQDFSELSDFVCGSCYEDFRLDCESTISHSPVDWYYNGYTAPTAPPYSDDRVSQQCAMWTSVDQNVATSEAIGSVFVEYLCAFAYRRPPDQTLGRINEIFKLATTGFDLDVDLVADFVRQELMKRIERGKRVRTKKVPSASEILGSSSKPSVPLKQVTVDSLPSQNDWQTAVSKLRPTETQNPSQEPRRELAITRRV